MEEIWTKEAKYTFENNIDFLVNRWSIKVADSFAKKTFQLIDLLKKNPEIGQIDERWRTQKILVVPQMYLFYEIRGNKLVLLYFWNNFKQPLF
ncbi:Plasmid stabilization system protein ParE [Salegentibacter echinorum]|uniref:Plasmid stabilization system protein ParE n=1 Tax=Salegentibacter echinorum TaxID=1073325 RepID=A0A1M5HYK5_SALEC|nr:type II toxin-antitoxin system RelE/ParE family toxin [Salegentibacter echinorum]SHG20913.1 Plasmid stabilization system protein ParE [Salegentibacter echinorum]